MTGTFVAPAVFIALTNGLSVFYNHLDFHQPHSNNGSNMHEELCTERYGHLLRLYLLARSDVRDRQRGDSQTAVAFDHRDGPLGIHRVRGPRQLAFD